MAIKCYKIWIKIISNGKFIFRWFGLIMTSVWYDLMFFDGLSCWNSCEHPVWYAVLMSVFCAQMPLMLPYLTCFPFLHMFAYNLLPFENFELFVTFRPHRIPKRAETFKLWPGRRKKHRTSMEDERVLALEPQLTPVSWIKYSVADLLGLLDMKPTKFWCWKNTDPVSSVSLRSSQLPWYARKHDKPPLSLPEDPYINILEFGRW